MTRMGIIACAIKVFRSNRYEHLTVTHSTASVHVVQLHIHMDLSWLAGWRSICIKAAAKLRAHTPKNTVNTHFHYVFVHHKPSYSVHVVNLHWRTTPVFETQTKTHTHNLSIRSIRIERIRVYPAQPRQANIPFCTFVNRFRRTKSGHCSEREI